MQSETNLPLSSCCFSCDSLWFKHVSAARSTRSVPTNVATDDEDDYDDSFINDDSEDVGDDSDYAPPDSDDGDKEDVGRLQKEAKEFLKRRK